MAVKIPIAYFQKLQEDSINLNEYIEREKNSGLRITIVETPVVEPSTSTKRLRRSKTPNEEFTRITRSKSFKIQNQEPLRAIELLNPIPSSEHVNVPMIEEPEIIPLDLPRSSSPIINDRPVLINNNSKRKADEVDDQPPKRSNLEQQNQVS